MDSTEEGVSFDFEEDTLVVKCGHFPGTMQLELEEIDEFIDESRYTEIMYDGIGKCRACGEDETGKLVEFSVTSSQSWHFCVECKAELQEMVQAILDGDQSIIASKTL